MTTTNIEETLFSLNNRLNKLEETQEQTLLLLNKIYHALRNSSSGAEDKSHLEESLVVSLDSGKPKLTNDTQFSYDNMIERPTTIDGKSRRKVKIKSEHIREYVIYADDKYDSVVTSAKETALKRLCKLAVQDLKNYIERSLGVNIVPWGDISVDMRENVIKRMESLANDQFGIPLHRCEGSWAADHLIRQAWSNSYGHIKRSRERYHNKHKTLSDREEAPTGTENTVGVKQETDDELDENSSVDNDQFAHTSKKRRVIDKTTGQ
ncbi:hypothetical protein BDB01DRAFT_784419 [Pilobolus umbonatus]|nr:hypothetical protein BDB01DRAFT_784419 [Pilobolus umbonatus]